MKYLDCHDLAALRTENARLISLLESHGIEWRLPPPPAEPVPEPEPSQLTTGEKVALFRRLFRGRSDVYPVRWESKTTGKTGYAPACANEWLAGVCGKPRMKCGDCDNRRLSPLSDAVIYNHLIGKHTVGVYPLLEDDSCYFLAVDFDEAEWRDDARAFVQSCHELGVPAALEISRSGNGAHAWVFFANKVSARDARRLGTALISHTLILAMPVSWKGTLQQYAGRLHREHASKTDIRVIDSWMPDIQLYNECGISDSADIEQWYTGLAITRRRLKNNFTRRTADNSVR